MSAVENCMNNQLREITGLTCLENQFDLAGHLCSLAGFEFAVIRTQQRFLQH